MRGNAVAPSECLSDAVLVDVVEGLLSPEALARVHRHAAVCPLCRKLLAENIRASTSQGGHETDPLPESATDLLPRFPAASPDAWTPPGAFDEFHLVRMLGRGGMGVVYLARDASLERLVAIKFIAGPHPSETARTNFSTEARAIARLKHPNVVTVFRVGEVEEHPYLVSEYIVGQRLADLGRPLTWRRALEIGRGLARGLGAAHRQGVLHRDIKPGNVLITTEGEVKLLDFGLAKFVDASAVEAQEESRVLAGTPRYMAPEVLEGASATAQSDIYSLGLVLYELCTGRVPLRLRLPQHLLERGGTRLFPEMELTSAAGNAAHSETDWRPLVEVVPGIDPDFAAIVDRCLRPEPIERFVSAEALREALEYLDRASSNVTVPAGNPYRGLLSFEAEHRPLFFGRDHDVGALLERLRRESLLVIAGDSGAGKSSLCRAGILPRVAEGALEEHRRFATFTMWPGRRPLEALATAIAPVLSMEEEALAGQLAPGGAEPGWLGRKLREIHRGVRGFLLFVDQAEELLTQSDPAAAARFAEVVAEMARPARGVRVLLAVRGDFLTRLAALPELGDGIQRGIYLLRPLSPEGVREAIVGPARRHDVVFESEALIATLMASAGQDAGSLPLLQFTLAELWERRDKGSRRITQAALEEMGGVAGALSRHADTVLGRIDAGKRQAARRILVRLVTEDGARIERSEGELGLDEDGRAAVRALVEGRLLSATQSSATGAGGDTVYRIAHEALIESWGTLRDWLDEDIGYRAIRHRLAVAAAEWERLGRSDEVLWNVRQIEEARPLDVATLGACEQAFLEMSRRAVRRRRYRRWLLLFPVLASLAVAGASFANYAADRRLTAELMKVARTAWVEGQATDARAIARREAAMALFDGRDLSVLRAHGKTWEDGERVWGEAEKEMAQAEERYARADHGLSTVLQRDGQHKEARVLRAELTYARILLAERFQQRERIEQLRALLGSLGEEEWLRRLTAPAELSIETTPPGARVTLLRYVDDHGLRRAEGGRGLGEVGTTPVARMSVPPDSYLLRFALEGRPLQAYPILLERGERRTVRIALPASVPEGYVYIPPGCFLFGSPDPDFIRKFMVGQPLHRVCIEHGYVVARSELTVGDWLQYLDTLPPEAPERRLLATPRPMEGGMVMLGQALNGRWSYSMASSQHPSAWPAARSETDLFVYEGRTQRAAQDWHRFPMTGISPQELEGYLGWLDRSGRLPGARLCDEYEWERAARGADERRYSHGDRLLPDDANIDATYDWKSFGPDVVGAHPASVSPFGVLDMVGNALEVARSGPADPGGLVLRGGCWFYDALLGALVFNRTPANPTMHDARVGTRICASFSVN